MTAVIRGKPVVLWLSTETDTVGQMSQTAKGHSSRRSSAMFQLIVKKHEEARRTASRVPLRNGRSRTDDVRDAENNLAALPAHSSRRVKKELAKRRGEGKPWTQPSVEMIAEKFDRSGWELCAELTGDSGRYQ